MSNLRDATFVLACDTTWGKAAHCLQWGAPWVHGCKHQHGHSGAHVCLCAARKSANPTKGEPDE